MAGMHCWRCSLEGEAPTLVSWRSCIGSERETNVTVANKPGFFRNALNALVEARQAEAERYVNGVLLSLDDETLKSHGYSRAELVRRGTSNRFWF